MRNQSLAFLILKCLMFILLAHLTAAYANERCQGETTYFYSGLYKMEAVITYISKNGFARVVTDGRYSKNITERIIHKSKLPVKCKRIGEDGEHSLAIGDNIIWDTVDYGHATGKIKAIYSDGTIFYQDENYRGSIQLQELGIRPIYCILESGKVIRIENLKD